MALRVALFLHEYSIAIGVRANIQLGGRADRVLPEWIRWGGGVVAEVDIETLKAGDETIPKQMDAAGT